MKNNFPAVVAITTMILSAIIIAVSIAGEREEKHIAKQTDTSLTVEQICSIKKTIKEVEESSALNYGRCIGMDPTKRDSENCEHYIHTGRKQIRDMIDVVERNQLLFTTTQCKES